MPVGMRVEPFMSNDTKTPSEVARKELLASVEPQLAPIKTQLTTLSEKYRNGGEDRIGWEILNAVRAIDEAVTISKLYLSRNPLPTLAEIRGIFKEYGHNPAHAIGTCATCGEEVVYNVPRLGPSGGYVHKATGQLQCNNLKGQQCQLE